MIKPKQRDYYFDNIKFILIVLVVIGHTTAPVMGNYLLKTLNLLIYTFHMHLFILLSGYFSKEIVKSNNFKKPIQRFLIPYIIFQIIYFFYFWLVEDKFDLRFFTPHWTLWFLLSVFCFYMLIHFFIKLKYSVIWALIIAIVVGYFSEVGYFLSLSRTFYFFPFFLTGFYLKREHFLICKKKYAKVVSVFLLLITALIMYLLTPTFNRNMLFGSNSYANLGFDFWEGSLNRLLIYLLAVVMIFCILSLVPDRKTFYSNFGPSIIYVYLLHGFPIRYLRTTDFIKTIDTPFEKIVLVLVAILWAFFLATPVVKGAFRFIVEPKIDFLFKEENS